MKKIWFGDWFILMQLCKNMQPGDYDYSLDKFNYSILHFTYRYLQSLGDRPLRQVIYTNP